MSYLWVIIYVFLINAVAFVMFGSDKQRSKSGRFRISEARLIGAAIVGGSVGAYLGMRCFRHKTKHLKFTVGIPVVIILQAVIIMIYFF